MAFQQTFKKTRIVKNIDNSNSGGGKIAVGFQQEYEEVDEAININYAGEKNENVILLCELVEKMNESQLEEFTGKIISKASTNNELSGNYSSLWNQIKEKGNIKQGVIEYIKSGTAVISLVNSLLSLAKIIVGK